MSSQTKTGHLLSGVILLAALTAPVSAQAGFFDQLFGAAPAPQPSYNYDTPSYDPYASEPVVPRRKRVKKAFVDEKPVLQTPTDIMHDKTLRPGDAVMMKTGMHIYMGYESDTHRKADFKPLDQARRIKPDERTKLAALDATRNDPLTKAGAPDTLASGRSAAVGSAVVTGIKFTDGHGKTIRYVGP